MIKKLVICAVIALILVPATVLAAGFGGHSNGTAAAGQGQCLYDGQNCANQSCTLGSGNQTQCRFGAQVNGEIGTCGSRNGQCTGDQNQTRSMQRLHDGSGAGCKNVPATQP